MGIMKARLKVYYFETSELDKNKFTFKRFRTIMRY
jgi:hypothetical protein